MILRKFMLCDYEEVVKMYYDFAIEVYASRKIGDIYFFYKAVQKWINKGVDIIVACHNENIVGFTVCYKDDFNGITEPIYQCDIAFVKKEFRNTRAAYMLYNNAYEYAKECGLKINTNGRIDNGVSKMMKKHFNLEPKFITYEGV